MRLFLGVVLVGWFGLGTLVSAQSTGETFELNVGVSGDNATPTIPTLLSVTPVTFSQIDVAWTAATDNIEVGGYQVYRDAILAGETSQTTFSDTGLSGSTTYTYTVRAFDISRNYSSTSNALSTTTPPAPLPPPEATSSTPSPTRVPLRLEALAIDPQTNQATLEWNTNRFSRFSLRWGRSSSYELGYVTSDIYSKDHRTVITDLEPGTRYEYELVGINQRGDRFVLSQDQFVTAEGPDLIPPANVANLNAQLVGDQVVLSWVNPAVDDFAFVRIVRSHLFYPTDPFDGFLVYQDDGEAVTDRAPFTLADTV